MTEDTMTELQRLGQEYDALERTQWQPIETAPKDGTVIILYRNRKGVKEVVVAEWCAEEPLYEWRGYCQEWGENSWPDDYFEKWMHLPPVPE